MRRALLWIMVVGAGTACAPLDTAVGRVLPSHDEREEPPSEEPDAGSAVEAWDGRAPAEVPPGAMGDTTAWLAALSAGGDRIVVSREERRLWLMAADSVVFSAPVAVGRDTIFHYGGQAYDFSTPTGRMVVQGKERDPLWVPPNWHYYEKAVEDDLEPVQLGPDDRVELSDSTYLEVRDKEVGRVNRFGNWRAFTPGSFIIFDGKIFIPPVGSPQRQIPKILGTHRLILGDGYLIHGTPEEDTIGEWASHGCIRLFNRDVEYLFGKVAEGTAVYVY